MFTSLSDSVAWLSPSKTRWFVSSSNKEEAIFILCPHLWFRPLVLLWCAVLPPAAACRRGQQGGGELQGASLQGAPPCSREQGWRRPWPRCSDRGRDRYRWKLARASEATGCSATKCRFVKFRFDLFRNKNTWHFNEFDYFSFLAVQDSSIGDIVTHWLID